MGSVAEYLVRTLCLVSDVARSHLKTIPSALRTDSRGFGTSTAGSGVWTEGLKLREAPSEQTP